MATAATSGAVKHHEEPSNEGRDQGKRLNLGRLVFHAFLIFIGLSFLMPFAWVASASLKAPNEVFTSPIQWIPRHPQWHNYADVFTVLKIGGTEKSGGVPAMLYFIRNTLYIVSLATLGTLLSSTLVAFGFSRLRWPGRDFLFALNLGSMMLPSIVTLVPVFLIFRDIKWINTFLPLIVPSWTGINGFYIFLLRQFFNTLPTELDEAARVDGASSFRILWQVLLPLTTPALASVGIFSFLANYNDFMGPLIFLNSWDKFPIALGIQIFASRTGFRPEIIMATVMMSILPVVVLFFLAQKTFIEGIQMTGIAGR